VEVLLGKLIEALRPNPFDHLQEPTLNAALALIASIQPRSEMEALMAVQMRFLRQSQHYMTSSRSTASPVKAISRRCSDACAEQAAGLLVNGDVIFRVGAISLSQ